MGCGGVRWATTGGLLGEDAESATRFRMPKVGRRGRGRRRSAGLVTASHGYRVPASAHVQNSSCASSASAATKNSVLRISIFFWFAFQ
jgi:hypothetical protein